MAGVTSGARWRKERSSPILRLCLRSAAGPDRTVLYRTLNRDSTRRATSLNTNGAGGRSEFDRIGAPNLRLMFDCYHVGRTEDDVLTRFEDLMRIIGHVQIAAVPDRGPPDHGELDYSYVFDRIRRLGWTHPIGAEYRPGTSTDDTLVWLAAAKEVRPV